MWGQEQEEQTAAGPVPRESGGPQLDWNRLQKCCLDRSWNLGELAEQAGLSRTTLYGLQSQKTGRPRWKTIARLATALGVAPADLLVIDEPAETARRQPSRENPGTAESSFQSERAGERAAIADFSRFDRQTNWCVQEVCERRPELFDDWSEQEWDELFSHFGTGGELNETGVLAQVEAINDRRNTLYELQVVLETHLGATARKMIHALYEAVQCEVPGASVEQNEASRHRR